MEKITERLLSLQRGRSRRAFAMELGVAEGTLRGYESGATSPNVQTLNKICEKLRINPRWLLLGEGQMYTGAREGEVSNLLRGEIVIPELEAKIAALEQELLEAHRETVRAYKLATENMQPLSKRVQRKKDKKAMAGNIFPAGKPAAALTDEHSE